jgi:hypothetical protein
MASKGRALDNVFIEPFWRTLKYEYIYLNTFDNGLESEKGLNGFIQFYNYERKHQSLSYLTPAEVYIHKKEVQKKYKNLIKSIYLSFTLNLSKFWGTSYSHQVKVEVQHHQIP